MGIFSKHNNFDSGGGNVSWWAESKKDLRFKFDGRCDSIWGINAAVTPDIEALAKRLGIEPPDDIEIGGVKD